MKILITGIFGQVGFNLKKLLERHFKKEVLIAGSYYKNYLELANNPLFRLRFTKALLESDLTNITFKPDIIINTAAYTSVDGAEVNRDFAYFTNSEALNFISSFARRHKALLIHLSSDYVFSGRVGGYFEDSIPEPKGVYGRSKLLGETSVLSYAKGYVIRFTPLGHAFRLPFHNKSFLEFILNKSKLGQKAPIFINRTCSPITSFDLFKLIIKIIESRAKSRLLHLSTKQTNLFEIARLVEKIFKLEQTISYAFLKESSYSQIRPFRSHLNSHYLEAIDLETSLMWLKEAIDSETTYGAKRGY